MRMTWSPQNKTNNKKRGGGGGGGREKAQAVNDLPNLPQYFMHAWEENATIATP